MNHLLVHALVDLFLAGFFYWFQWYTVDLIKTGIGPYTAIFYTAILKVGAILSGMLAVMWVVLYFVY